MLLRVSATSGRGAPRGLVRSDEIGNRSPEAGIATARRLAFDHWSIAPRTTALQSALNC